jgi:catechol-2,3-dioxygenase
VTASRELPGGPVPAAALLFVRDLDRSLPFYQQVFQLQVRTRHQQLVVLETGDGVLAVALREVGGGNPREPEQVGISRMIWSVPDPAAVRQLSERLHRLGARDWPVGEDRKDPSRTVIFTDPDGIAHVVTADTEHGDEEIPRAAWLRGL